MIEFKLPQFGMGMQDGTVVKWHKQPGDRLSEGELLVEIEAAKSTVEVAAPCDGTLREILVAEDDNVPIQTVLALIEEA